MCFVQFRDNLSLTVSESINSAICYKSLCTQLLMGCTV